MKSLIQKGVKPADTKARKATLALKKLLKKLRKLSVDEAKK